MDWYSETCADDADLPAIRARQEARASITQAAVDMHDEAPAIVHPDL